MNKNLRTTHKVKLEILSPVFIGSGKEYSADEYFILEDQEENIDILHRFDSSDVFEIFSEQEKRDIVLLNAKPVEMRKKINSFLKKYFAEKKITPLYSIEANEKIAKNFYKNIKKEEQNKESNQLIIHEFIQNSFGKKYIPGSSIKGAIATAMQEVFPGIKTGFQGDYNDLMITDSESLNIENFEIKKLKRKGGKSEIPADYEIFLSGSTEFSMKLKNNDVFTKEKIRESCNQYAEKQIKYSLEYIQKRISGFEKYGAENIQEKSKKEAYQSLKDFFTQKLSAKYKISENTKNYFLLNVGFGGIAVFKMLSSKYEGQYRFPVPKSNIKVENFPSTFWMTEQNQPLGWVKCTFLD